MEHTLPTTAADHRSLNMPVITDHKNRYTINVENNPFGKGEVNISHKLAFRCIDLKKKQVFVHLIILNLKLHKEEILANHKGKDKDNVKTCKKISSSIIGEFPMRDYYPSSTYKTNSFRKITKT